MSQASVLDQASPATTFVIRPRIGGYTLLCQEIISNDKKILHGHAFLLDWVGYINEILYYHHGKQIGWQLTYRASCENYIHRIQHIDSKGVVTIDKYKDHDFPDPKFLFPNEDRIQCLDGKETLQTIYDSKVNPSSFKNASELLCTVMKSSRSPIDPKTASVFDLYPCARNDLPLIWKNN